MFPHATLEIPDSSRRLEKILKLARSCDYSVHDLSRVQLDRTKPRVPRFNMPFELGLCVADANRREGQRQDWFVFEAVMNRIDKSLSDGGKRGNRPHGKLIKERRIRNGIGHRGTETQSENSFHRKDRWRGKTNWPQRHGDTEGGIIFAERPALARRAALGFIWWCGGWPQRHRDAEGGIIFAERPAFTQGATAGFIWSSAGRRCGLRETWGSNPLEERPRARKPGEAR
jgi:hypothetical protein